MSDAMMLQMGINPGLCNMPTISIFFGFVVQMYWRDHPCTFFTKALKP
jgi:hypothetical protein